MASTLQDAPVEYRGGNFFSLDPPDKRKPRFDVDARVLMRENEDEEFLDEMIVVERFYVADSNKWEYALRFDKKNGKPWPPRVAETNLDDNLG